MKRSLLILSAALFMLAVSCQKEVQQKEIVKEVTIDATISTGSDYFLQLAEYGSDGDSTMIVDKGDHSAISKIEEQTDMFTDVYHYKNDGKSKENDKVTLSIKRAQSNTDSLLIYINFTVK